ncbi:MAG: ribonuclease III [Candidatus Omnitrophica bacterium]|nr:ribonuclease III [Candidatus Omnitrophota bacterium]
MIFFRSDVDPQRARQLHRLERVLGTRFRRLSLLNRSLMHRSYLQTATKRGGGAVSLPPAKAAKQGAAAESVKGDNETLEFLGDAVVGLVVSEELYRLYPLSEVGDLAKVKAQVVSRATLGEVAESMGLDQWILLGPAEVARGEGRRTSVIGSALEAVLGALYLDRGMEPVARVIRRLFRHQIEAVETGQLASDYKSLLQEYALRYFKSTPDYRVVGESGPSHRRRFHVSVGWHGKLYGQGAGPSKKAASQEAARAALERLT